MIGRKADRMTVEVCDERLELHPDKVIYWPSRRALLLADMHLGKVSHFRRAGIPVPVRAQVAVLENLVDSIKRIQPLRVIFLGDLFHSHYNREWEDFGELVKYFSDVSFQLITGNHDIMSSYQYKRKNISVHDQLHEGPFVLTHAPVEDAGTGYNLAGHIHPAVRLGGKGRRSVMLPCFYFGRRAGILPSFGVFTGFSCIHPEPGDQVYVVIQDDVISVS